MQRNCLDVRVNLSYGTLAADMVPRQIEPLRFDSENPVLLYSARISVAATPSGTSLTFAQFKDRAPQYLMIQNVSSSGYVTVAWDSSLTASIVTQVPAGAFAILPDPLETSGVIYLLSSSGSSTVELAIWGDPP